MRRRVHRLRPIPFAGGYWINASTCVPLLVRTAGRQVTGHVGIGTTCPAGY